MHSSKKFNLQLGFHRSSPIILQVHFDVDKFACRRKFSI